MYGHILLDRWQLGQVGSGDFSKFPSDFRGGSLFVGSVVLACSLPSSFNFPSPIISPTACLVFPTTLTLSCPSKHSWSVTKRSARPAVAKAYKKSRLKRAIGIEGDNAREVSPLVKAIPTATAPIKGSAVKAPVARGCNGHPDNSGHASDSGSR